MRGRQESWISCWWLQIRSRQSPSQPSCRRHGLLTHRKTQIRNMHAWHTSCLASSPAGCPALHAHWLKPLAWLASQHPRHTLASVTKELRIRSILNSTSNKHHANKVEKEDKRGRPVDGRFSGWAGKDGDRGPLPSRLCSPAHSSLPCMGSHLPHALHSLFFHVCVLYCNM